MGLHGSSLSGYALLSSDVNINLSIPESDSQVLLSLLFIYNRMGTTLPTYPTLECYIVICHGLAYLSIFQIPNQFRKIKLNFAGYKVSPMALIILCMESFIALNLVSRVVI